MLRSILCDLSDSYIFVKRTIIVANTVAQGKENNRVNQKIMIKNCAPFTNCISRINNTQVNDASYIDVVMSKYNLTDYSDNYLKESGILWQIYRDTSFRWWWYNWWFYWS